MTPLPGRPGMREVAEYLGNTAAVAKASYVDPRVVDLFHSGSVVKLPAGSGDPARVTDLAFRERAERAVLGLLPDP